MSQLKVLSLENCSLDDEIAKRMGEGFKLLEEINLTNIRGPLTNNGLNNLLLISTSGIRRLPYCCQQFPQEDPLLVIINCSTLTYLDLSIYLDGPLQTELSFPISQLKLNRIREL